MKEQRKLNKGCKMLLLFTLVISSIFLFRPSTVKADINVNINKEKQVVTDMIGQYTMNYTGDVNFFGFDQYPQYSNKNYNEMITDDDFKSVVNTIGKKNIKNSSVASLKKTAGATKIEAAYLVWETSVQGKDNTNLVKKTANKAVYFAGATDEGTFTKKVNATYAAVDMREPHQGSKDYTFSCMYADVTATVQKYGYGKYGVANIPYANSAVYNAATGTHLGESSAAWQLIVIEQNGKAKVRAISLKVGSHFNYQQENGKWTGSPVDMNLNLGDCKTNQYIDNNSKVEGELLLLGTNSAIVKGSDAANNSFGLKLYDQTNKGELAYSNEGLIGHSYFYNDSTKLSSNISSVRGILTDFSMNQKNSVHPGFSSKKFRAEASDSSWSTLFVVGLAVDVADYDLISNQDTTVTSAASTTVTGGIQVKTDQPNTGYYDGKLVVTLDDALTPIKGETIFTVLDKVGNSPKAKKFVYGKSDYVTYDAAKHTLTVSGYDNKADGSYVDYTISCTVKENSGKKVFKNQYEVTGKLRSQKYSTGIEKKTEPLSSQAVPMYRFTVKMDKTAGKNIDIQRFNSSGRYTSLFTVSADQKLLSGDYYVGSVDIPYNGIISAVPTFNTGYVFSMWTDLNEKTGVSTERKATSDMVNDKTYAYERQMPAYNVTLTLTGVLDEAVYTVCHWKQKTTGIAFDHDDKNYELAETETKKAQIGSKVTPAVKTYTGFDSPKTQTKAVTADGKMVIDYYYERHLYNVTLNAGTGIENTTGGGTYRYGQNVMIDAAVKEGYHWSNWTGNYTGGSGGDQTVDTKKFTFTMPAGNVTMTANAEANKYTIHFDPNGGAGHIDDIETTYDTDVTLPDVWNADGTAAYVKYTLDGQNVTDGVISGAIPKAMMAGYEEETEEIEDTEDPDNAEDPEGAGNSENEDSENNGDDSDAGNSDADAQDSMDEAGNAETADNSDESDEAETADNSDESDEAETADNSDVTDDTDQNEKVAVTKENKDDAEDIDALNDLEEEDIEENKKAEEPKKKVYASVFMGWSLEDGKDTFIPQWKAGDAVRNLVAEDGGEITLYAVWDDCPWIQAQDLYYTLEQAQSGFITEEEILSHATATDREDGSPILPGTNPAPSDPGVFTSFTIPDYQAEEFTNLQHDFAISENLTVVDHVGNTYVKQIMVHVTDTTPVKVKPEGKTRFISEKYFNLNHEHGGFEENSIWMTDPDYHSALQKAFDNLKNDTPEDEFLIPHETILEMKQYVQDHGIGNSKEPGALTEFYNRFMAPNKVE